MADIVVAHHDLNKQGGGEAVCMTIIEALQNDHNVTLLTSSSIAKLEELNDYYDTDVENIHHIVSHIGPFEQSTAMQFLDQVDFWKSGYLATILKHALYNWKVQRLASNADLFISTWNEVSVDPPSVQYIHYPHRYRYLISDDNLNESSTLVDIAEQIKDIAQHFSKFDLQNIRDATLLANSERTASRINELYNVTPQVLYPPINTSGLSASVPWGEREDGIIFLSRIHPCKNILSLIDILDGVRNQGHDIHFHIIGPRDQDDPEYFDIIKSKASNYNFVSVEGPMYGDELHRILKQHKYGINGNKSEQFGMSIAEMVASGMVPFVPNGGGQRKIVNEQPEVIFDSVPDAVNKITRLHSDPDLATQVRDNFPDIENTYGKDAFKNKIRSIAESNL